MTTRKWKQSKDLLFRGDRKDGIGIPDPSGDDSIVRHVLFLEGAGRKTPYLSTSEHYDLAENFAQAGAVWKTYVAKAKNKNVGHIGQTELLGLMKGNGKGKAKWPEPFEVMQARRYVEQWGEHLLDFRNVGDPASVVQEIFERS
jgi:hypothetical protein